MSIYRKQIDFPEEYRDKLRRAVNSDPGRFKSSQGHVGSVNVLIIQAVDIFLNLLLTQLNENTLLSSMQDSSKESLEQFNNSTSNERSHDN